MSDADSQVNTAEVEQTNEPAAADEPQADSAADQGGEEQAEADAAPAEPAAASEESGGSEWDSWDLILEMLLQPICT